MRKKQGQQIRVKQLSLFPKEEMSLSPVRAGDIGNVKTSKRESNYFSLLARNRAFTERLLEKVVSPTNLNKAYESVRRNGGASGVDEMEVMDLEKWLRQNGQTLISQLQEEEYLSLIHI